MKLKMIGFSKRFKLNGEKLEKIIKNTNFKLVDMVSTVGDLLNSAIEHKPDVIIIDTEMNDNNYYLNAVIKTIYNNFNKNIVVITKKADECYKDYYMVNALYWKIGVARILNKMSKRLYNARNSYAINISNVIAKALEENNFSSSHLGYHYLAKAIELCYERNGFVKNLTTEIYSKVADYYDTNYKNVERNIRHAIKCAINQHKISNIKEGDIVRKLTSCSNRKVIASFANSILIKSRNDIYKI